MFQISAHQVLAYPDDVNLIGDEIKAIENADVLSNSFNDTVLAINTGKTKYSTWKHKKVKILNI